MANYKPNEMAAWLRRCAEGTCDDKCPWCNVEHDCSAVLMTDAAEVLEEVAGDD